MSREAFEAWATASGYESKTGQGMDYPLGRALWIAWQAATAAALEEAAKDGRRSTGLATDAASTLQEPSAR